MPRLPWIVRVLAVIGLAGCGGSSHRSSTSESSPTSTATVGSVGTHAAGGAAAGMAARVLAPGELPGFQTRGPAEFVTDAGTWASQVTQRIGEQQTEVARLKALGFIAAAREQLDATRTPVEGISIVEHFRSARSARLELAHAALPATPAGVYATTFAVPAIPGARGFAVKGPEGEGSNVAFAKGPYYYLVGAASEAAATRAALIAAAQHLYKRVSP